MSSLAGAATRRPVHDGRRAAEWYFTHDLPADAIRHALAAGEWGKAAAVVDSNWHDLLPGAGLRRLRLAPLAGAVVIVAIGESVVAIGMT